MSDHRLEGAPLPGGWTHRPAVARIDDYLTGGCENYAPDRALARRLVQAGPWLPDMTVINRRHRPPEPAAARTRRTGTATAELPLMPAPACKARTRARSEPNTRQRAILRQSPDRVTCPVGVNRVGRSPGRTHP